MIKISTLNRYIWQQLTLLWLFSVGLLSAVGVALGTLSDLAAQISNDDLPITVAVKLFFYQIPEFVAYAIPIATLLATLIVYGRLNSDRELVALRSLGINLYQIVLPALYFSVIITLLSALTNEWIVPHTNYQTALLQKTFLPETELSLQSKDIFYPEYKFSPNSPKKNSQAENDPKQLQMLYFAEKFDGVKFHNIILMGWQSNSLKQIITAKYAQWDFELNSWQIQQGSIDTLGTDILDSQRINFTNYQLKLPDTFFKIALQDRDPQLMSLSEAIAYLKIIVATDNIPKIRLFKVRIHQKIAFPSICLIFALVGSALGAKFSNFQRGQSFGICVAIVFSYYLLGFIVGAMGIVGLMPIVLSAWIPNLLGLGVGWWLLRSADNSI